MDWKCMSLVATGFFCCVGTLDGKVAKMLGHIYPVKINKHNVKSLVYNAYKIQTFVIFHSCMFFLMINTVKVGVKSLESFVC